MQSKYFNCIKIIVVSLKRCLRNQSFYIRTVITAYYRPNPQEPPDLFTFTEEILKGKPHFLCSVYSVSAITILAFLSTVFT